MSKKKDNENSVILKLRDIRKEKGFTISALADKAGVDYQKIGRAERGETSMTIEMLIKLAKVMDVPLRKLIEEHVDSMGDDDEVSISDDSNLMNMIPLIYEEINLLCSKKSIKIEDKVKVQLATMMYKIVQDIRINVQDDEIVVKALFQGFDAILERVVLN